MEQRSFIWHFWGWVAYGHVIKLGDGSCWEVLATNHAGWKHHYGYRIPVVVRNQREMEIEGFATLPVRQINDPDSIGGVKVHG